MKFVMSYSFGKDSALALYRLIQQGHEPVALLTTVDKSNDRSWVHGIQEPLMQEVAKSIGLPLILCKCEPSGYAEALEKGLAAAKQMGAQGCAFGDIDLEGHKEWNEQRCKAIGLECLLPLWQRDRAELVNESLQSGFCAMIKLVQTDILSRELLGQTLSPVLLEQIKATGADVCGENGEYHTFVFDGPIFNDPIKVYSAGVVEFENHAAADIRHAAQY